MTTTRENNMAFVLAHHADGFTLGHDMSVPTHGVCVGVADSLVTPAPPDESKIEQFCIDHKIDSHVGIWTDTDTGLVYVDSIMITSLEIAIMIGQSRGEIAVYDLEWGEIRL